MAEPTAEATPPRIVAIDGPAGVGKSTVSRLLADKLGLPVLDTGAMYRAAALAVLQAGVDPADGEAARRVAEEAAVAVRPTAGGGLEVLLDGEPVGDRIRTPEVSEATSKISADPAVRRRLVTLQRRAAEATGAVVEGRDIGTVVFPDTPHKFFLDADSEVRAARRWQDLRAAGRDVTREEVRRHQDRRDERDSKRRASPLTRDDSYTVIDTSHLTPEEVVERMAGEILGRC